jgi:hypothetical protein
MLFLQHTYGTGSLRIGTQKLKILPQLQLKLQVEWDSHT